MAIVWTHYWGGTDDGTTLKGIDLRNIQDDLAVVQTIDDVLTIPGQTQGDVIYYNGSAWVRLPAGTDGQILVTKGAGANPEWGNLDSGGSPTEGDILYWDGSSWVTISPGTAGDVLTSNGAGTAPSFELSPGGTRIFTADGTFTPSTGVTAISLTMIGGGGSGGNQGFGTTNDGGAGGGSGAWVNDLMVQVTPGVTYTIQVGVGGAGGGAPADGEDTIFDVGGTEINCDSGKAGGNGTTVGAGGTGGQDMIPVQTAPGLYLINDGVDGGEASGFQTNSGAGAGSPFGSGAAGVGATTDGLDATVGFGCGGSGAGFGAGQVPGGGSDGFVMIHY